MNDYYNDLLLSAAAKGINFQAAEKNYFKGSTDELNKALE